MNPIHDDEDSAYPHCHCPNCTRLREEGLREVKVQCLGRLGVFSPKAVEETCLCLKCVQARMWKRMEEEDASNGN